MKVNIIESKLTRYGNLHIKYAPIEETKDFSFIVHITNKENENYFTTWIGKKGKIRPDRVYHSTIKNIPKNVNINFYSLEEYEISKKKY